ncbi:hypothetical protein LguiA_030092 [Lonicera macranthoides]
MELIRERVSEIEAKLGYKVEKDKSGILELMKEKTVLLTKILEVTPELRWVELKLIAGGEETEGFDLFVIEWRGGREEVVSILFLCSDEEWKMKLMKKNDDNEEKNGRMDDEEI